MPGRRRLLRRTVLQRQLSPLEPNVEDLVYRPLFLRMARLGTAPFYGEARFSTASPHALSSLAALCFFLTGSISPPILLDGALGVSGGGDGNLVLMLWPDAGSAREGEAATWKGEGELRSGPARFSFELGNPDRLWAISGGARRRIVLPEGGPERYALMDEMECAGEGRESRILPKRARAMALSVAKVRGA